MNQRYSFLFVLALGIILFSANHFQAQVSLRIGDAAPAIKYSTWFKGTPVVKFEKGEIYVMEFWATWCSPCKESAVHLTELAHKYKDKITIIGMDEAETTPFGAETTKRVADYITAMGDKMDYNVALDNKDEFMKYNWMHAAGQDEHPIAFIIDKDTKIAWIGHPMNLDEPIAQMIEGKYDLKAFAEKFTPAQEKAGKELYIKTRYATLCKSIIEADKANNYAKVILESESLLPKEPLLKEKIYFYYFRSLLRINPKKAISIAKETEISKIIDPTNNIISRFTEKGLFPEAYNLAIGILQPLVDKNHNDFNSMMNLAPAYENMGNTAKAIEIYEKMIAFGKRTKAPEKFVMIWEKKVVELKSK